MNSTPSQPAHTACDEAHREPRPGQDRRRCSLVRHLITTLILFAVFIAGLIIAMVSGLHSAPSKASSFASVTDTTLRGPAINTAGGAQGGVRLVSWDSPAPPPNATIWPSSYGVWYQWPDRSWRQQPAPASTGWPTGWPTQSPTSWPAPQQDGWPTGATWPPPATSVANTPVPPNEYWPNAPTWPTSSSYPPAAMPGAADGKLACPVASTRDISGRGGAAGMRINVTVADAPGRNGVAVRGPMIVSCGPAGQLQVAVCAANPNYRRTSQAAPSDNRSHRNTSRVGLGLADRVDNIVDSALDTALGATSKTDSDTDSGDRHRRHSKHERGDADDHSPHGDSRWDYDDDASSTASGNPGQKWICPSAPRR